MSEEYKTIYGVLEKANELKQPKRRIQFLKDNESFGLITIFQGNFKKEIDFHMTEGAPPFKENNDTPKLENKLFNFGPCFQQGSNVHQWAREGEFIKILQNVNKKDAEVIVAMKDKTLTDIFPNITKEIVEKAWPKLL